MLSEGPVDVLVVDLELSSLSRHGIISFLYMKRALRRVLSFWFFITLNSNIYPVAGQVFVIHGSVVGTALSATDLRIPVPFPFTINGAYSVQVNLCSVANVIGGTEGATYTEAVEFRHNTVMLKYSNPDTIVTDGRAYICMYTITITCT